MVPFYAFLQTQQNVTPGYCSCKKETESVTAACLPKGAWGWGPSFCAVQASVNGYNTLPLLGANLKITSVCWLSFLVLSFCASNRGLLRGCVSSHQMFEAGEGAQEAFNSSWYRWSWNIPNSSQGMRSNSNNMRFFVPQFSLDLNLIYWEAAIIVAKTTLLLWKDKLCHFLVVWRVTTNPN